jgi:hypothetical protein
MPIPMIDLPFRGGGAAPTAIALSGLEILDRCKLPNFCHEFRMAVEELEWNALCRCQDAVWREREVACF